MYLAG
jgi:hypothetical protein